MLVSDCRCWEFVPRRSPAPGSPPSACSPALPPPLPQSCASSTLTPSPPAHRSASCARASCSPPPSLATTRSTSSRCERAVRLARLSGRLADPEFLPAASQPLTRRQPPFTDCLRYPTPHPVPAALPQSLGDDDTEAVESSSATLMETEEGYQVRTEWGLAGGHLVHLLCIAVAA